jgi:hypothetical protein
MTSIDISKLLPSNLKNDFWTQFCDAISDELNLFATEEIDPKKYYYYVRTQDDITELIQICNTFGFMPDRSIDESLDFLKRETRFILYKIKDKSTLKGYNHIFSSIQYPGLVYNLYYNSVNSKLTRIVDLNTVISNLNSQTYSLPFTGYDPLYYFLPVENQKYFDIDDGMFDADNIDYFDTSFKKFPIHHLAVEYTPISLLTENSTDYYMTNKYLDYLRNGVEYNRKVTEVPHIGFQLNMICDESGFYNNLSLDNYYSVPNLKMQCGLTTMNAYKNNEQVFLDAVADVNLMDFDLEQPWMLDQETINPKLTGDLDYDFYKIILGDGGVGLPSKNFPLINENLIGYWSFDETEYDSSFYDLTANSYTGSLFGNFDRQFDLLNQSLYVDGQTAYGLVQNIKIDPDSKTLTFWFKTNKASYGDINPIELDASKFSERMNLDSAITWNLDQEEANLNNEVTLIHLYNYMEIFYKKSDDSINVKYKDGISTVNLTGTILDDNSRNFIGIIIDTTALEINLYINGSVVDTKNFTTINPDVSVDMYIGRKQNNTQYFMGSIDEVRWYGVSIDVPSLDFMYGNQFANIFGIANVGAVHEVANNTDLILSRDDTTDWYIISGRFIFTTNLETDVEFSEFVVENAAGVRVFYSTFPSVLMKRKNYLSYMIAVKK